MLVTVDTDEHPRLAQQYSLAGLPDIRFLSPDGEELHRQRDFQDAEVQPPVPTEWMHQLGTDERLLDGVKLHESVETLLNAKADIGPAN